MHPAPRAAQLAAALLLLFCTLPAFAEEAAGPVGFDGRVVVAPLNLGVLASEEVAAGLGPVWKQTLEHFVEAGHMVAALERESAQALWRSMRAEARVLDPEAGVHDVYARFALAIAEEVEYSTLIFPALVTRVATVRGEQASWDGVKHWMAMPRLDESVDTLPIGGLNVSSQGGNGEIAAASLHVAVFGPDGVLRYEGTGGLTLLQSLVRADAKSGPALLAKFRDEPFADAKRLREGIEAAFRQPLPASPAPAD